MKRVCLHVVYNVDVTHLQGNNLGIGCNAWRAILAQRKAFSVQHGQQRDICKLFSHLTRQCQFSPFHGTWDACLWEAGVASARDQGVRENMSSLDIPDDGACQYKDVINGWGGQANIHALRVSLRLNRFQRCSGGTRKVRSTMGWVH